MAELMLVNPRRKRRRARRPMTAKQARYFGPRRKRTTHRRRRAVTVLASNPVRRRKSTHRRRRRHVTRLRRNPMRSRGFNMRGFMNSTLIPAGIGAMGALGVDLAMGYFAPSLPVALQSGMLNNAVKIAGAVGVGMVAGMVAGKKFGEEAMAGAITVTIYDIIKGYAKTAMPTLPLSGYNMGWVSPAYQIGPGGMGMYVGSDHAYSGSMTAAPSLGMYVGETEADYI